MKRRISGTVLLAALVCCITGCGSNEDFFIDNDINNASEEAGIEISVFGYKADSLNLIAIEDSMHGFMEENPDINISYECLKGQPYYTALDKRANTGNLDDIVMVDHDSLFKLINKNVLEDLSDISTINNFREYSQNQFINDDGTVYCIPTALVSYGLYINYDMLNKHGKKIPENFEEFSELCDYFVSEGITPIVANNSSSFRNIVVSKGLFEVYQNKDSGNIIDSFNENPNSFVETLKPGLELAEQFLKQKWIDAEEMLQTNATSDDLKIFSEGERPFMLTGSWASVRLADMNPKLNYGIHPYPFLDDGSVLIIDISTCLAINSQGENVDVAKEFLEYLTHPETINKYCDTQSCFSPIKGNFMPSDEAVTPLAEYMTNGRSVIGSDLKLELPLDSALMECGKEMAENNISSEDAAQFLLNIFNSL